MIAGTKEGSQGQAAREPETGRAAMTHILPPHSDISLHSALHMDQRQPQQHIQPPQQQQQQQQQPQPQQAPSQPPPKKRRKPDSPNDDLASPSEPRRLRRSHEACARCRSKKIKASPVGSHRPQISVRLSHSHPSATLNTQSAPPVRPPPSPASKRTGTGRPSPYAATLSLSSAKSPSVTPSSSVTAPVSTSPISRTFVLARA